MPDFIPTSVLDGTHIKDDFMSNSAVADASVGELRWEMTTIGNASTPSYVAAQNGVLRVTTAGTANGDGEAFTLHPDHLVLAGSDQIVRTRVRYPSVAGNQLAGNNFRIGFSNSVTATEPSVGVWIDSDAGVLSFDTASTNGDRTKAVARISTLTSGTTMVLDTWHDLELRFSGVNANGGPALVDLYVDDEHAGQIDCLLGAAETMECSIVHWQDSGGAATLELDIDYYEAWLPRN